MQGEGSAFFQHAQGLQQDRLPVPAGDVVVDVGRVVLVPRSSSMSSTIRESVSSFSLPDSFPYRTA